MSLSDVATRHEIAEAEDARIAVRRYQRGDRQAAEWFMALAAEQRHLAFEAWDTDRIASRAFSEWILERLVARS